MDVFSKLQRSHFRSSFRLSAQDRSYIKQKGIETIREHAYDFLTKRIQTKPKNDTKQTPWTGHPVFKAQHATATCCRKCIEKWHKIPQTKILTEIEINSFTNLILKWIEVQL